VRSLQTGATALVAAGALAVPASAQVPGLTIDPDSPSAKEYALPFENERRQADPAAAPGAGVAPGVRSSPAFGAGVTAGGRDGVEQNGAAATGGSGDPGSAGSGGAGGGGTGSGGGGAEAPASQRPPDVAETIRRATAAPGAPDGGLGGTLSIVGIAAAVLLVGGAAGVALRRRGA
jgi:hypothetical protein